MASKKLVLIIILAVLIAACVGESGKSYVSSETRVPATTTMAKTQPWSSRTEAKFDLDEVHVKFDGLIDKNEEFNPVEDNDDTDFVDLYQLYSFRNSSTLYIGLTFYDLAFTSNSMVVINLKSDKMYQILLYGDSFEFKDYGYGGKVYYKGKAKKSCTSMELVLDLDKLRDMGIDTDFTIRQVSVVAKTATFTLKDSMSPGIKPFRVKKLEIEDAPGIFEGLAAVQPSNAWKELNADGVVIRYHKGDRSRDIVLNAIKAAKVRVCSIFNCPTSVKITIYANHEEYENAVGKDLPVWTVGIGRAEGIELQSPSSWGHGRNQHSPDQACQIVVHEYTHYVVANIAGSSLPRWLNEGLAVYLALQINEDRITNAMASGKLIPIEKLDDSWDKNPGLAYSESGGFVRFLVEKYGWDAISRILLEHEKGINRVLMDVTGKTLDQLEDEWIG
ncbi:peptidase MA family metallohydrolase [Archaeoglobus neptunius]|uniref:peptidase MA family metallohydrolase n=1 Tax=Archaeoglobus neptunius TaxID=2798580 RepID=UPI0019264921|nr:peptidase MA family metallohydrolase [Archaeoglobus neptunius]